MSGLDDELKQKYKQEITTMLIKIGLQCSAVYSQFLHKHSLYSQKGAAKLMRHKMLQKSK